VATTHGSIARGTACDAGAWTVVRGVIFGATAALSRIVDWRQHLRLVLASPEPGRAVLAHGVLASVPVHCGPCPAAPKPDGILPHHSYVVAGRGAELGLEAARVGVQDFAVPSLDRVMASLTRPRKREVLAALLAVDDAAA